MTNRAYPRDLLEQRLADRPVRAACMASLAAARFRQQPSDTYVPATQAALLVEQLGAVPARTYAIEVLHTLASNVFDRCVWAGETRESWRCVLRRLEAIVNEDEKAASAANENERTGTEP
ncbi:MAG TPA: hypothetical protein VGH28_14080 [Polyangiaceae bacterium]|jgi:hypothetical protein